ncbi:MAG: helix-turn-helix domain-containing protein [Candidatus Binataceae bacterium]
MRSSVVIEICFALRSPYPAGDGSAVILSRGIEIALPDFPDKIVAEPRRADSGLTLEELERRHIETVLEQAVTLEEAAEMLGINVATLWRKRRKYGLD